MKRPQRRHVLELTIGADTLDDLETALIEFSHKVGTCEMGVDGVSGGYSWGWTYRHIENKNQTHDGYFLEINNEKERRGK